MLDQVHTNEQRIEKIQSVFTAILGLKETLKLTRGEHDPIVLTLEGISDEAGEAQGSLEAIEKFLGDRSALLGIK